MEQQHHSNPQRDNSPVEGSDPTWLDTSLPPSGRPSAIARLSGFLLGAAAGVTSLIAGAGSNATEELGDPPPPTPHLAPLEPGKRSEPPGFQKPAAPKIGDCPAADLATFFFPTTYAKPAIVMDGYARLQARAEAFEAVKAAFDIEKVKHKHLAPGLIEFTAPFEGKEQRFYAVGRQVFRAGEVASPADRAKLAAAKNEVNKLWKEERALLKALDANPSHNEDLRLLRYHRDITRIDTSHLPPERAKELLALAHTMKAYDTAYAKQQGLETRVNTLVLSGINADKGATIRLMAWGSSYDLAIMDGKGDTARYARFDARRGKIFEHDLQDAIDNLVTSPDKSREKLRAAGDQARPYLRQVIDGTRLPKESVTETRAQAALLLASMGDEYALPHLVKLLDASRGRSINGVEPTALKDALIGLPVSSAPRMAKALEHASPDVREAAARYFAAGRYPGMEKQLIVATLEDENPEVRKYSALALGRLGSPAAIAPLIEVAGNAEPELARRAGILLSTYADARAVEFLRGALSHPRLAPLMAEGAARSNDPSMAPALRDLAAGTAPPEIVRRGLARWAFRGVKSAQEGMILGSGNPYASPHLRQYIEMDMQQLDAKTRAGLPALAAGLHKGLAEASPRWQRRALDEFITARKLGIEALERLPAEHRAELFENRLNPKKDGRPLVAFVYPVGDHNGAFYGGQQMLRDLVDRGYRVMYYEIETDKQLVESLRDATGLGTPREQKASLIVIGGHGTPTTIHFERHGSSLPDKRGYLDIGDAELLFKGGVTDTLAKGGLVLVESCSGGHGSAAAVNMANFMRKVFPQAAPQGIWSVTESYAESKLIFDKLNKIIRVEYDVPHYRARLYTDNDPDLFQRDLPSYDALAHWERLMGQRDPAGSA